MLVWTTDPSWSEINLKDLAKETGATGMLRNYDYDPITQFRLRPLHGGYVNVEEGGFRRVWGQGPWPLARSVLNIFVLGGSTTFGLSLNDGQTIPSYLQRRTRAASQRLNVYNFGRPGYTSTQELLLYLSLLRDGSVPNAAVFIDGLNECQEWTSTRPAEHTGRTNAFTPPSKTRNEIKVSPCCLSLPRWPALRSRSPDDSDLTSAMKLKVCLRMCRASS
jgi:hypothetical protein